MSVNKVILLGNVGKEPEIKEFTAGKMATLTLATTDKGYTLQNGTQVPDRTEWHNLVINGKMAEVVEQYVHKGDRLYVEGKIRYRSYEGKDGQTRYVTEVMVSSMEMLTPKRQESQQQAEEQRPQESNNMAYQNDLPF